MNPQQQLRPQAPADMPLLLGNLCKKQTQ